MKRRTLIATLVLAALALPLAAQQATITTSDAELDATLNSLNSEASTDMGSFTTQLSAEFGMKKQQQLQWLKTENLQPAELYLLLELGRMTGKLPEDVLRVFQKNRGKGWGSALRALGIKPGSAQLKALKAAAGERYEKTKIKELTMHQEMDQGRQVAMGAFKSGDARLDANLNEINIQASADLAYFTAQLSADFGAKQTQLRAWIDNAELLPAEVYLVLELARIARKPPSAVLDAHRERQGQGWGAVIQALGLKPYSPEFKALIAAASERRRMLEARE